MAKILNNVTRFSRPVGSNEPYRYKGREVRQEAVHIGTHAPTDYFTSVSHEWVPGLLGGQDVSRTDRK